MVAPVRPGFLNLSELFFSIQGEGTRAGLPCAFVRLHGCSLRCSWCDTPYALDHREGGTWWEIAEIIEALDRYPTNFVEITGGEPLEQPEVHRLIGKLLESGRTVAVETGGHVDIADCDPRVVRIMDLKTPSSGMLLRNRHDNLRQLTPLDEVKFVCGTVEDYEWAKGMILEHDLPRRVGAVLIAPVFGAIEPLELVARILEDGLDVRFQLQMHKYIWDPEKRGV